LFVVQSTHTPPQLISPAGHDTLHAPLLHTWPDAHTAPPLAPMHAPLAPQNCRLVVGSTQVPLQSTSPG
jgi:hypothetical protein